jgi:branched-chain amino acid aminotransferase
MAIWTWWEGKWHDTPPAVANPMTHAMWLGSCVFDGARAFEGTAPDLDQHCRRVVASARTFGLKPQFEAAESRGAGARRHREIRAGCRALHPAHVLGR